MAALRLGTTQYLHTLPLIQGAVAAPGLELQVSVAKTIDECTLRTLKGDFDAGEFSLATFLKVCESGGEHAGRLVGVPVFAKKLVSQYAFCRADDVLDGPASLAGRRIAVPQFWVTAALWHRHYMESAGLDPAGPVWCPLNRDRIEGMPYPERFRFDWSLLGRKPAEVLRSGEADCFIFARRPGDLAGLRYLARDPLESALATVRRTGFVPVTHVLALRRELHESRPEIAAALLEAFQRALAEGAGEVGHVAAQYLPLADMQQDAIDAALGAGWNGHGWARNEKAIQAFCETALAQGFVGSVDADRIFVKIG